MSLARDRIGEEIERRRRRGRVKFALRADNIGGSNYDSLKVAKFIMA